MIRHLPSTEANRDQFLTAQRADGRKLGWRCAWVDEYLPEGGKKKLCDFFSLSNFCLVVQVAANQCAQCSVEFGVMEWLFCTHCLLYLFLSLVYFFYFFQLSLSLLRIFRFIHEEIDSGFHSYQLSNQDPSFDGPHHRWGPTALSLSHHHAVLTIQMDH